MRKKYFFFLLPFIFYSPSEIKVLENDLFSSTSFPLIFYKPDVLESKISEEEIHCLALNIYFEAGIENTEGKKAVAHVTLNRVNSDKFPNTICEVVKQSVTDWRGLPVKYKCQFSWFCDGKSDNPWKGDKWYESKDIAKQYANNYYSFKDRTKGSLYYHADYVNPNWAKDMKKTIKIGKHIFYKIKG